MEEQILILNVLKFEKDGKSGCRVSFIYCDEDKLDSSKNFLGYSELSLFYPSEVFNKFKPDMICQPCVGTFEEKKDSRNPLKSRLVLKRIETDETVVDLL